MIRSSRPSGAGRRTQPGRRDLSVKSPAPCKNKTHVHHRQKLQDCLKMSSLAWQSLVQDMRLAFPTEARRGTSTSLMNSAISVCGEDPSRDPGPPSFAFWGSSMFLPGLPQDESLPRHRASPNLSVRGFWRRILLAFRWIRWGFPHLQSKRCVPGMRHVNLHVPSDPGSRVCESTCKDKEIFQ